MPSATLALSGFIIIQDGATTTVTDKPQDRFYQYKDKHGVTHDLGYLEDPLSLNYIPKSDQEPKLPTANPPEANLEYAKSLERQLAPLGIFICVGVSLLLGLLSGYVAFKFEATPSDVVAIALLVFFVSLTCTVFPTARIVQNHIKAYKQPHTLYDYPVQFQSRLKSGDPVTIYALFQLTHTWFTNDTVKQRLLNAATAHVNKVLSSTDVPPPYDDMQKIIENGIVHDVLETRMLIIRVRIISIEPFHKAAPIDDPFL